MQLAHHERLRKNSSHTFVPFWLREVPHLHLVVLIRKHIGIDRDSNCRSEAAKIDVSCSRSWHKGARITPLQIFLTVVNHLMCPQLLL